MRIVSDDGIAHNATTKVAKHSTEMVTVPTKRKQHCPLYTDDADDEEDDAGVWAFTGWRIRMLKKVKSHKRVMMVKPAI